MKDPDNKQDFSEKNQNSSQNDSPESSEKAPSPKSKKQGKNNGMNSFWLIFCIVLFSLFLWNAWYESQRAEIPIMQLVKLIEKGSQFSSPEEQERLHRGIKPSLDVTPQIIIEEGTGKNKKTFCYYGMNDICISPNEVTGKIFREEIIPIHQTTISELPDNKSELKTDSKNDNTVKTDSKNDSTVKTDSKNDGITKANIKNDDAADHNNNVATTPPEKETKLLNDALQRTNASQLAFTRKNIQAKPEYVTFFSGRQGLNFDNNELFNQFKENGFENVSAKGKPGFFEVHGVTILITVALVAFLLFLFARIGTGAMAFGRTRGALVSPEDVHVTFNDVAGVDEAMEELHEIVDFLRVPDKFRKLGGRIPKGVLLVGPPGTGKTLLAKAVAGEAKVPFFSLSGSDFVELYAGVGAARVRDLFQQAQSNSPCIVFIDELDALGKTRNGQSFGSNDEREQTLNALLVEMDGFETNAGVIVMAATNRPEILDSALLRSGRFDRQVLVDRPDINGRQEILKIHSKNIKLDPDIDLRKVAALTGGFAGADLEALVNEAALLAARADKDSVTMDEFNEGIERVTAGLQKKKRVITEAEKKRISFHECGHALVAHQIPHADPVHKVSIIPRGLSALGYTLQRPEDERFLMTRQELEARIQILLAGIISEDLVFQDISTGASSDLSRATEIARNMVTSFGMSRLGPICYKERSGSRESENAFLVSRENSEQTVWAIDQEIRSIIDDLYQKTKDLLIKNRDILDRLAEHLLENEVLDAEELDRIIKNEHNKTVDSELQRSDC